MTEEGAVELVKQATVDRARHALSSVEAAALSGIAAAVLLTVFPGSVVT